MTDPSYIDQKLKEFECRRCNRCCQQPGFVYLEQGEPERLATFLGLSEFDFINQFCDLQDRRRLVLKKYANEHCVFLTPEGCQVHAVKPRQCQDFPRGWRTPASFNYCEGLKKLFP